jgi:hypothetical protein
VRVTGDVDSLTRCDVAMEADGDFVVVWNAYDPGSTAGEYGIYARRYSAAGAARGAAFLVTASGDGDAYSPSVAVDGQGGFVVAWNGFDPGSDFSRVFARRYGPSGAARGGPFPLATTTGADEGQDNPSVAAFADGGFVVAWETYGQDPDVAGAYARQYDAAGQPTSDDFRVSGEAAVPAAAVLAPGGFVIAWSGFGPSGDTAILARRYVNAAPVVPARVTQVFVGGPQLTGPNPSAAQ